MTLPSVVIQTYLTLTAKRWGQAPTITFTNGATAGSEVVSVDSSNNITVQISSGTSTMLQIKNAIAAHSASSGFSASDLVTVSITGGHNSDAVSTFVSLPLASGVTSAVKASVIIGSLKFTAHTAGTAGNSLQVRFTPGATAGSEVVTDPSSGAPLTIQIANAANVAYTGIGSQTGSQNSGSTAAQIKTAIDTWQSGNTTYFDITFVGPSTAPMSVSSASTAVSLAGGLAAAPAVATHQGVTVTSITNDATQNGATVTLTTGATAGSEVVTVSGNNVSVSIQDGTSTVTQIRTAMNSAGAFSALYTATGTASTHPTTVNAMAMTGAVGPSPAGGALGFYQDQAGLTLTTSYQYQAFGNEMGAMSIYNDEASGSKTVIWSYDGVNNHGSLLPTQSVQLLDVNKGGIYIKEANGAPAYRVFATAH